MTTNSTAPIATYLGTQLTAFTVGKRLAEQYPNLPGAYVTIHQAYPGHIAFQLSDFPSLERWRETLVIDPTHVTVTKLGPDLLIEFTTEVSGVTVRAYAIDLVLTPFRPAPRPGEFDEQRHLLDPLDHALEALAPRTTGSVV